MRAIISVVLFISFCSLVKCNCNVNLRSFVPTPLFIDATHKTSFHNPLTHSTNLVFSVGDKFVLACTGAGNKFDILNFQELEVKCQPNGKFSAIGFQFNLENLKCKDWPTSEQRKVGYCGAFFTLVQTVFHVANNFIPVMDTCFDDRNDRTLYTKMTLSKYAGLQTNVIRPDKFDAGQFFK